MTVIRYTSAGQGNGESWASASMLDVLNDDLQAAQPGDEFLIGFDRDREDPVYWDNTVARLDAAGSNVEPIRVSFGYIAGDDAVASQAGRGGLPLFRQSGASMRRLLDQELRGAPFLVIGGDARNVSIVGPTFSHSSVTGFIAFQADRAATITDVHISDVHATMAGRVIETGGRVTLERLILQDCTAVGLVRGFARFQSISNSVLRNLKLDAAMVDGGGTNVCQIISVVEGSHLRFEGVEMANAINGLGALERGSTYIQGDGLVCEEKTSDIEIIDCHADNFGDGGFDLKTDGVRLIGCSARACKYGMRIWTRNPANLIDRCAITSPRQRVLNNGSCIWCAGSVMVVDSVLRASDGGQPIRFGESADRKPPVVTIVGGSIDHPANTSLTAGNPGEVILTSVRLNGTVVSGRGVWSGETLDLKTTPG